ncbi:type II toxin-antitoxin system VapC family toxin [Novosphingobium album (ex Liu et al. 2023)]|uniref:Type II toxin-antitoxin system VapC family toxin n=1 Tax=Novosphingobium album (ex Liu et al. 2023) TaxID=3031130 RepID=A0ABT5WWM0_9SPHN|nr:type II toxin-antitoxin system VapC family toxin [Novosphingobium album (ex Liu et al. 2023)]MDE8654262.1 type II toxin-antitoxin system VapC family toxin [Novosphingobium album (ex Liu et al. 2023)]
MTDYVLDASAVLAVIQEEPGSDRVEPHLRTGIISAVNLAEIVSKLQERNFSDAEIDEVLQLLVLDVHSFDEQAAIAAGKLRTATRDAGLSLGDRACLALAAESNATALTTDRAWEKLKVPIAIELAR